MKQISPQNVPAIILLAAVASGCMSNDWTPEEPVVVHRQEIQGGTTDSTHTSVVGIVINTGQGQAICSGTLIAPNLVLTAQHCVAQLSSPFVVCGQSPFGAQYPPSAFGVTTETTMPQSSAGYTGVSSVHVPPGGSDACGFDIALLQLSTSITTTEPIVPRIDIPVTEGETYTAIGYGHIGNGSGAGTRRQLANREVLCATGDCPRNQGIEAAEFAGTDGTCQGDSGGAPLDAEGRVLGALSRGPDGCLGSVYSSVSTWATWLRNIGELAASEGGYTAPTWVTQGVSETPDNDPDLDGIVDPGDNCPNLANPDQLDLDGDGMGDECDPDVDGDGIANGPDNCPLSANPQQFDYDNDTFGDECDLDDDNDGVMDEQDNCQFFPNASQTPDCGTTSPGTPAPGTGTQTPSPSNPSPYPSTQVEEGDVVIVIQPEPIHATGRACTTADGSPLDLALLPLTLFGFAVGRRRRGGRD